MMPRLWYHILRFIIRGPDWATTRSQASINNSNCATLANTGNGNRKNNANSRHDSLRVKIDNEGSYLIISLVCIAFDATEKSTSKTGLGRIRRLLYRKISRINGYNTANYSS